MFECVDRKRFDARVTEVAKKIRRRLALLHARLKTSPEAFESGAGDVVAENAWLGILEQVGAAKPTVTVEDIQVYALGEVLRIADSPHPNNNQLRAWAKIVDLTRPGSMLTSK